VCVCFYIIQVPPRLKKAAKNKIRKLYSVEPETVGDLLIYKCPQSAIKGRLALGMTEQLEKWGIFAAEDTILQMTANVQRAPDIAGWTNQPTARQWNNPVSANSICPLPNIWVEICYQGQDMNEAMHKIQDHVIPNCGQTCCILIVVLQRDPSNAYFDRMGRNAPPTNTVAQAAAIMQTAQQAQIAALQTAIQAGASCDEASRQVSLAAHQVKMANSQLSPPQLLEPTFAPKIGYWPAGWAFNQCQWFAVHRGQHIDIDVPGAPNNPFQFDMDCIVDVYP
jgi:hypothetical protein